MTAALVPEGSKRLIKVVDQAAKEAQPPLGFIGLIGGQIRHGASLSCSGRDQQYYWRYNYNQRILLVKRPGGAVAWDRRVAAAYGFHAPVRMVQCIQWSRGGSVGIAGRFRA